MRPSLRSAIHLSLFAVLTACDGVSLLESSARPPVVRTQSESATVSGDMPLLLVNESQKVWEYGACSHRFDRLEAGAWQPVDDPTSTYCILPAYSLAPGAKKTLQVPLPATAGTYRIRFGFLHFPDARAETVVVTSNTFQIVDPDHVIFLAHK